MPLKLASNTIDQLKTLIDQAHAAGADGDEANALSTALDTILEDQIKLALAPLETKMTSNLQKLLTPVQAPYMQQAVKGQTAARALRAFLICEGDRKEAASWAKGKWGDDERAVKTLIEGTNTGGGFLISGDPAGELIELLRPQSVVRSLGPTVMTMTSDSKPIPRIAGGASSGYIGENTADQASDLNFDQLVLRIKKLRATVAISNELNDDADGETDQMVINDIVASMAITEDVNFLRGDGTAQTPQGLLNWAGTTTASGAANDGTNPTLTEVRADIATAINSLTDANSRMIKPAWIMSHRTRNYMMWNIEDGNGNLVFQDQMATGKLNGWDVGVSNNVPNNLASGTQGESEIYLVDMADVVLGDRKQVEFKISTEASFVDSAGNTVSAFDNDLMVIRAIARHDLVVRHPGSIHVTTGVVYVNN